VSDETRAKEGKGRIGVTSYTTLRLSILSVVGWLCHDINGNHYDGYLAISGMVKYNSYLAWRCFWFIAGTSIALF
jgi:hypothetical protein